MKAARKSRIGPTGCALRSLMAEAKVTAREIDRGSLVSADTVQKILDGRTQSMTDANLSRLAVYFAAVLGRAITAEKLRAGKVR